MSAPTIDDVTQAVRTRVEGLGLSVASVLLPVVKGKQPKQEPGAGAYTQITVHPAQRPHEMSQLDTVSDLHVYHVTTTVWTPGNQDNVLNATDYAAIDDAIVATLDHAPAELAGLEGLYDVRARTGDYVDRGAFSKNWDVQVVDVEVQIVRLR